MIGHVPWGSVYVVLFGGLFLACFLVAFICAVVIWTAPAPEQLERGGQDHDGSG